MKKLLKLSVILIALFTTISFTSAYFNTSTNTISRFNTKGYEIKINANGGIFSNSSVVQHNSIDIPIPTRVGYSFSGYSNTQNGSIDYLITRINIDDINTNGIFAIWSKNSYIVDINPVIDGTTYNAGLSGFTFDVWIDGILVADDVVDWYQSVNYGSVLRVKTNNAIGRNTYYDQTITIGTNTANLNPTWTTNSYQSDFYLNGGYITSTYNKYGATISTPSLSATSLGYNSNFYYLNGFTPWTSWTQPDYTVGFSINIVEYNCLATFGTRSVYNANAQLVKLKNAGYNICYVSGSGVVCYAPYSSVIAVYNDAWNILPRSGNGYSIYKSINCDSGWGMEQKR